VPAAADELDEKQAQRFEEVLAAHRLVMAPTELSTTAPLKRLAPRLGFRAATMPGFTAAMVPALRLDYHEVDRRVRLLKGILDRAEAAELLLRIDGSESAELHLDLRHRTAHASSGLLHEPGTAGNLPSGEAYIVPYEGELQGDPSRSAGVLPIQLGGEVVRFRIDANRAVAIDSEGLASDAARQLLAEEPATGNLAELGLGVLADLGVKPIGQVLLDEKLGLHLAFGRSDHFGGRVGPGDFSRPEAVIHQDHVFLPELQPRVVPALVELVMPGGTRLELLRDGNYTVDFDEGS
jgi:leucyl aminopeptidase (aminopeptidase T)